MLDYIDLKQLQSAQRRIAAGATVAVNQICILRLGGSKDRVQAIRQVQYAGGMEGHAVVKHHGDSGDPKSVSQLAQKEESGGHVIHVDRQSIGQGDGGCAAKNVRHGEALQKNCGNENFRRSRWGPNVDE